MAGQVGRPRKSSGEPKSPYTKRSSTQPQYLNGFTGRSTEQIFRVSPDPKILIGKIEDDYRLISKDKTKKMSAITLKYLRDHRIIKAEQYVLYSQISERPEERTMAIEKNVIEWVNSKLIGLYENS